MAYVALYRAHRPQKFSEVYGQKHIVTTLQNAIKLNKVAHAYLFCGPRGTGKTTLAKIMAKALNCEHGPSIEPCNECPTCIGITKGMINDVIEIDAASNNGVDEIRELREGVKFSPSVGNYKVYIIDEVHMLSTGAFNALLKTLEEPPKHAIFILATTEVHKIPATILSRCQRFDFQSISNEDVFNRIKEVAMAEKINIEEEAISLISEICEGGMRDALSLLDQSLSYSTDDLVSTEDVLSVSGNVSSAETLKLLQACLESNGSTTLTVLNEILNKGKEIPRVVNDLIIFLRDVLLQKVGNLSTNKAIYKNQEFILFCNEIKNSLIYSWLNTLNEIQNNIKFSNQKRAFLELGLLTMSDKEQNEYATLLNRIEKLEKQIALGNYHIEEKRPIIQEIKPVEIKKVPVVQEINQSEELFVTVQMIEDILNNASKQKKDELINLWNDLLFNYPNNTLIQILCGGQVVAANDNKAIIILADEAFCNRLMKYENFIKILEMINKKQLILEDYICLTQSIWNTIKNDYTEKYRAGNSKPKLENIKINIKQHVKPDESAKTIDPFVEQAYDLFDKDIVKIKEEF